MDFSDKKILVVGFGKSGLSVSRFLLAGGAHVTVNDIRPEKELDKELLKEAKELGARFETGEHRLETFVGSDMIVVSPGVPLDIKPIQAAREKQVPVWGELELASRLVKSPIIAVTGTNGKSTAVSLLGDMMNNSDLKYFMGGNLGIPLMEHVLEKGDADYILLEVSSFQLDTIENFCPEVSLLLNISPDHLDRYSDYEAYVQSKLKIFKNQKPGQLAILNDDDERLSCFKPKGGVTVLRYGFKKRKGLNAFIEGNRIFIVFPGKEDVEIKTDDFHLPGRHNLENLMGVLLAAYSIGLKKESIERTISEFRGLPHRMEYSGRVKGIDFYNDSKATNIDSAIKAIESFNRPVILIAGGKHKGAGYQSFVKASEKHVKKAVLIGEARPVLAEAFEGIVSYIFANSMEDAVLKAFKAAEKGDVVLLAPACSSFDMFADYMHRGAEFKKEVKRLGNDRSE